MSDLDIINRAIERGEAVSLNGHPYVPEQWAQRWKDEVDRLRARNGRLRKAVNWMLGAMEDCIEREGHAWECQRARDILAEGTSDE